MIEALLILTIAGIIGGAAWYVKDSTNKANVALSNANDTLADYKTTAKKNIKKAEPTKTNTHKKSQTTTPTSNSSTKTTTTVTHPTATDIQKAKLALGINRSSLEAYYVMYGYYPGDLSSSNFTGLCTGDCYSPAPPGTKFVYKPTPSGCTTSANNCQHYTLSSYTTSGTLILQLKSF